MDGRFLGENVDLVDVQSIYDSTLTLSENLTALKEHCKNLGVFEEKEGVRNLEAEYEDINNQIKIKSYNYKNEFGDSKLVSKLKEEHLVILINGKRGCLPKGTIVMTPEGNKPIEDVKNLILSYDFDKNKKINSKCQLFYSGKKKVVKIKTKNRTIECSPDHKWFVKTKNGIEVKQAKDLNTKDSIILID